ncbi:SMC-Scp complex subunit ScpB [Amorphus sp. 3PC139-8]|uniref:SMC-Scp complex subunit ScpB n=1 Tax=Amorphus sp. 3PC139-8 TaxID=2735676 RepID=UPI00345D9240
MPRKKHHTAIDLELEDLPAELRWREWMGRVEAVIFASPEPVGRDVLARVVGRDCSIDHVIRDIREELRGRPYELVAVAGGWQHRTRKQFADAIHAASGTTSERELTQSEMLTLACIAYYQPITRKELGEFFGKEVSRDVIATLKNRDLIASGPRSPEPGAPYTYVTTSHFLSFFSMDSLRDLPDIEALEDAGLLSKKSGLQGEFPMMSEDTEDMDEDASPLTDG